MEEIRYGNTAVIRRSLLATPPPPLRDACYQFGRIIHTIHRLNFERLSFERLNFERPNFERLNSNYSSLNLYTHTPCPWDTSCPKPSILNFLSYLYNLATVLTYPSWAKDTLLFYCTSYLYLHAGCTYFPLLLPTWGWKWGAGLMGPFLSSFLCVGT